MTKREFLSQYSVKLTYIDKEKSGSGILVPVDINNCYLITAKHNFDKEKYNPFEDVTSIDNNKIKVLNDKGIEVCKISKCVYKDDNPDDDLVIFSLKDMKEFIKSLDPIFILKDEPHDEVEHFFRGYPNGKPRLMDGFYSRNIDSSKPNLFTFRNQLQIDRNYLAGYSGSGVFIKNNSLFYLVGIVLESKDGIYEYTCYDLSKVIDKINRQLKTEINFRENIEWKSKENKTALKREATEIKVDNGSIGQAINSPINITNNYNNLPSEQEKKSSIEKIIKILLGTILLLMILAMVIWGIKSFPFPKEEKIEKCLQKEKNILFQEKETKFIGDIDITLNLINTNEYCTFTINGSQIDVTSRKFELYNIDGCQYKIKVISDLENDKFCKIKLKSKRN